MAYSRPDTAGRPPPHDLDAEAAVLSALILQPEAFHTVAPVCGSSTSIATPTVAFMRPSAS